MPLNFTYTAAGAIFPQVRGIHPWSPRMEFPKPPAMSGRMICIDAAGALYHCREVFTVPRELKLHDE